MFFMLHGHSVEEWAEHPEWGEPDTPHYVLGLREQVEIEDRKEKTMALNKNHTVG